jgi:hypothetical protein
VSHEIEYPGCEKAKERCATYSLGAYRQHNSGTRCAGAIRTGDYFGEDDKHIPVIPVSRTIRNDAIHHAYLVLQRRESDDIKPDEKNRLTIKEGISIFWVRWLGVWSHSSALNSEHRAPVDECRGILFDCIDCGIRPSVQF